MAPNIATAKKVGREELLEFIRPRHHVLLMTSRADQRPQVSPVSAGIDSQGRMVIATYPQRAKARNIRRNPQVTACVLSDDWNGPYVQVNGDAEAVDMPEALDGLVEYFRSISGEHPDWQEYREAMVRQNKTLIRVTIADWGPIATGGFPPELAQQGV